MDPLNLSHGECKALAGFASTDESRPVLQNIHVRHDGTLEATDGHKLLRIGEPLAETGVSRFLHRDQVKTVKSGRRLILDRETGSVEVHNGQLEATLPPAVADATFPDTDKILPKYERTASVVFRADNLKALADAAAALTGNKEAYIRLTFGQEENGTLMDGRAVMFEVKGSSGTGLVMPCRDLK